MEQKATPEQLCDSRNTSQVTTAKCKKPERENCGYERAFREKNKLVNSHINSRIPDLVKTVRDLRLFFFSISVTHLQKPKAWTSLKVDQKKHTCLTYGVGLVAYLLIIFSVSSCMISSVLSKAVLASCSTTQGSRATCDVLPAPAHDRASPIVNCTSTCRICSVRTQRLVGTVLL